MNTISSEVRVRKKIHLRPKLESNGAVISPSSALPPPPWIDLPRDITANILHRLGAIEILESAQKVCTTWWRVCKGPEMWRVIDLINPSDEDLHNFEAYGNKYSFLDDFEVFQNLVPICCRAVDRSLGELIDINMEHICTDDLLRYISDRSPRLKCLRIAGSDLFWGEGFTEAVKKLPELEELHLFYTTSIYAKEIETISRFCPMLKSFTFNSRCYMFPEVEIDDSYALVIAKNMPSLRQLRLFGNRLSNRGLQAILDGCPHLELIDLRQCLRVDLQGDLDKRCSERIKDLRRPSDSTADYEWDDEVYDYESSENYEED